MVRSCLWALTCLALPSCLGSVEGAGVSATSTTTQQAAEPDAQNAEPQQAPVSSSGSGPIPDTNTATPIPLPDVGTEGDGNYTIGPGYQAAPQMAYKNAVPHGKVSAFTMDSAKSTFYTGFDPSLNSKGHFSRDGWLYVPAQYQEQTPAPFMIVQDGGGYKGTMPAMLDNMIADKSLPVMLVIFINPGPGDGRGSERGLEYDTVSDKYVSFVEAEVLPKLEADYPVRFTADPEGRATMGGSSGGAAAFTMAWFRPDLYHKVLTYSGTFVNQHPDATYPHSAWAYHEYLIAQASVKPIRVFLEAGQNDNNQDGSAGDGMHNWVTANNRMSDAFAAKGYHYRYLYAKGAGHVDGGVVGQTLPETLLWLWRGFPIP